MRKPTRIISIALSAILMVTLAAATVAADKKTSFDDLKSYVISMNG